MNAPQLPDYLKKSTTKGVKDKLRDSLGQGAPPYLSIQGGRFTLVDSAGNEQPVETADKGEPYVDVVIIDSLERISKIYYGNRAFDPANPSPPVCFSDNGIAPSRNAGEPQSPTCASCQWFPWGSAVSKVDPSKRTKACQDVQKLALMVPGTEGIFLLRVPPNSLKPLREYEAKYVNTELDPFDVITRIKFQRGVLGTLNFAGVSFIDEKMMEHRDKILESKATDAIVGRNDQPVTGAIAAPQPTAQLAQHYEPAPSPKNVFPHKLEDQSGNAADMRAEAPLPARKRGRPKATPAAEAQTSQAPFPTASNPGGIQQAPAPGSDLAKTMDDFFGSKS